MKYRMYVDEVGNHDLESCHDHRHRHLSLTGVIMELGYVDCVAYPALEEIKKRYFGSHPDEPVILHRKEMMNARPPFDCLEESAVRARFDAELLALLGQLDYVVVTVVIDKQAHLEQYRVWRHDPYHYCMKVLLERYVMWLQGRRECGDVMAESRGGKEDLRLKQSFLRLTTEGGEHIDSATFARWLTSRQLKVKPKANNVAGLQLADLVAHPSWRAIEARRNGLELPSNFGGQIARLLLDQKYRRSPRGEVEGWGIKWLP